MPPAAHGPHPPHDLVHAAVEQALGIADGFWGAMAQGGTFKGFDPVEPSRHRRSGLKVLRRRGDAVMAAELKVGWAYRVWSGQPLEGRAVGPHRPLDEAELARAVPAIDAAAQRWRALPEGGELVWAW